nr:hypothetical protein [Bacillus safensis]
MSLSTAKYELEIHKAIQQAVGQGIIVVCAAGNGGRPEFRYPSGLLQRRYHSWKRQWFPLYVFHDRYSLYSCQQLRCHRQ